MPTLARETRWPLLLFALCLSYALGAASIGWHHTVLDFIGFRQAQTALTTFFTIGQPPRLAYETPVVGSPYQVGAVVVHTAWLPIDRTAMQEAIVKAGFSATYHRADPDFEIYSLHAESVRSE